MSYTPDHPRLDQKFRTVEFWRSPHNGNFYWRVWAPNGNILATSGEGYVDKSRTIMMFESLFRVQTDINNPHTADVACDFSQQRIGHVVMKVQVNW